MLIAKKVFLTKEYTFGSGKTVPIEAGYETYGTLNADRDNVILVCHYFSATSHAAGVYTDKDAAPGWWDGLIGPGKALDTNRYFIVCMDNLCNVQWKNPMVTTTGPASVNRETGRPYGMEFPPFSCRDVVEVQKQLLESLGISRLHAVVGPSLGGMIALQWAVSYPDLLEHCIGVITNAKNPAITSFQLQHAVRAIQLDPNWRGGMYYGRREPEEGLRMAAQMMYTGAFQPDFYEEQFQGRIEQDVYYSSLARASFEKQMDEVIQNNARLVDANHWLYTCRATMYQDVSRGFPSMEAALARIQADVLLISCEQDVLQPAHYSRKTVEQLRALGKRAEFYSFSSPNGHMAGVLDTHLFEEEIRRCISRQLA
ncbi:alpha/beta fold hydrolase [Ectobacillus ponti]|uniref:Probable acyltransferase n=1 Tax=Ectobacillus ponti TaxID=2961894 RepID=A0AA42BNT2_9BACI|nr:homoserine O-acetyltransferase [Ectobacillus ponti]MCP8968037.1 homoserine O-acetyltransferase [Ectobacillus ponti]